MWIFVYPFVEIDDFFKVSYLVWAWDSVDMYLTHLGIRIQRGTFHIYKKVISPSSRGKKNFFFEFECYYLANGNE
jgi:hypothetical protein